MNITTGIRVVSTSALLAYAVAIAPANALATNRYAGVGGSTTDPACTDPAHPCDLVHAIGTVAADGDDVTVQPGRYTVPSALSIDRPLTIHGQAGVPRPTITADGLSDATPSGTPVLRYLTLDLSGSHLFFGRGVAEQLIVLGDGDTCSLGETLVFRDNVCVSTLASGPALDVETNAGNETLALHNDTLIATGPSAPAVKVATQVAGGTVTVNLFNTIAQGSSSGADIVASTLGNGTATVNTNHSVYTKAIPSGPGAAINTSVTDQHTPAAFVPGTYREAAASSSTIGKGATDVNNGPFDFDGDLRSTAGSTDIGADQYVTAPAVTAVAGSGHDGHATITATIDTHGSPTSYVVHYGPTAAYGSTSAILSLPPSGSPAAASVPLAGLTPGATYHFVLAATNSNGTTVSADSAFTNQVTPAPPPASRGGQHLVAPQDSALSFSHSSFSSRRVRTSRAAHRTRSAFGTSIVYTDTQAATTTLTIGRPVRGVLRAGRCVAASPSAHRSRRCWRYVTAGTIRHRDRAGRNLVRFTGSIHGHTLRSGRYRMTAVPVNTRGMRGRARTDAFTIVGG